LLFRVSVASIRSIQISLLKSYMRSATFMPRSGKYCSSRRGGTLDIFHYGMSHLPVGETLKQLKACHQHGTRENDLFHK
jgi:hypothetical protein